MVTSHKTVFSSYLSDEDLAYMGESFQDNSGL